MSQQATTKVMSDPSLSDLVDHLTRFDGPPDQFLLHMLAVQCHVGSADGGTILRSRQGGDPEVLAVYPAPQGEQTAPVWLAQTVEMVPRVVRATDTVVAPLQSPDDLYEQAPKQNLIMIPLRGDEGVRGVAAFIISNANPVIIDESRQRLELTVSLLSLYEMRLTLQRRQTDMQRLRQGLEVLSSVNDHARFKAAAMGLCNEIASVWQAERVTLGFVKGRYVRAVAMSHTEKLTRKMKLVLDIESAMEECFDQDVEVIHPAGPESTFVSRATGELAVRHGPMNVCSFPLRQNQKVIGVLLSERAHDKPFDTDGIESLRLVCELCTARLSDLWEHDKWFGAKAAGVCRKGLSTLLGAEYTWVKLLAVVVFALGVFLVFAKGNDYVDGSFVVQAIEKKVVPAPYDGYLYEVKVERGDDVVGGQTVLATLDTTRLRLQLGAAMAEQLRFVKEVATARKAQDTAQAQMAAAQADRVQKEIEQIKYDISRGEILAPVTGVVITGDLKKNQGAPVEQGDVLFEISPVESMRAEVSVPEDRITDLFKPVPAVLYTAKNPADGRLSADASFALEVDQGDGHGPCTIMVQLPVDGTFGTGDNLTVADLVHDLNGILDPASGVVASEEEGRLMLSTSGSGQADSPAHLSVTFDGADAASELGFTDEQVGRLWRGELTAVSQPGLHIPIEVERISPVAEVVDHRNVFRVRARFVDGPELAKANLRPGLEGQTKIKVGRAHYAWIWTREMVFWIRMKLWLWFW